jgi:nucleoside-diphosphate-sugar epimerase
VSVVVVGADGTLGRILVSRLGARGVSVRCPDARDETPIAELADASVVVNAGGPRVRPELAWGDYFREHVGVTSRVVRSMKRGAHLVHVSSTAVYGARATMLRPTTIEAPTLFPSAAYACAKLAAESMARSLGGERGLDVSVVRPSMVYGPGIDSALETIRKLARRGVALALRPRAVRQHLVHIDLLCAMIAALLRGPATESVLLAADPFVLTNADLAVRAKVTLPISVASAASMHRALAGVAPSALEALAVLGLDNEFDSAPALAALGIDLVKHGRAAFDAYWEAT